MYWSAVIRGLATLRPFLEAFALFATPIAALWGICTYHRSAKLERAKWMKELYEKFHERTELKTVRDILDGGNPQMVSEMVKAEDPKFTDYPNFFEFLAYLVESKQITEKEMRDLFDYYLQNLRQNQQVLNYINDHTKGFEKLGNVLAKLE